MSTPIPKIRELHYLFTVKPHGRTVAHCLDLDIVTAADDLDEAEKRLDCLVTLQIEGALNTGNYAALSTVAPQKFFETFNACIRSGQVRTLKNASLKIRVPEVVPLEHPYSSIAVLAATSEVA